MRTGTLMNGEDDGHADSPAHMTSQSSAGPDRAVKLVGRHAALQPIRPQDYDALRMIELSADLVPLWRHQGATPSPEQWAQGLWNSVLAQFLVVDISDSSPVGI